MTNDFLPIVRGLDWGCTRHPKFATDEQVSKNMKRVRCMNAEFPIQQFDLSWAYLKDDGADLMKEATATDFEQLVGFFYARHGKFESFLFRLADVTSKDSDSHVGNQTLGTGDGAEDQFQLVRDFGSGQEIIQAVQNLVVRVNDVELSSSAYTLGNDGVITLDTPPANGFVVTADFDFAYRVTFVEDEIEVEDFLYQLYQLKSLTLIEDRL